MKTIVCFGDSNTWGYSPSASARYPFEKRWTSILQKNLGSGYFVIPEGLNGRTTAFEDPIEKNKNGYKHLKTILETHKPIDLLIIMLGTNDLKSRFAVSAEEIALSAARLVDYTLHSTSGLDEKHPEVLFIAPPMVMDSAPFGYMLEGSVNKSKDFGIHYKTKARELGVPFLNASDFIVSGPSDGIHWEEEEHAKFATVVAEKIRKLIS
jgi:lysophospholipase L1-like esterase